MQDVLQDLTVADYAFLVGLIESSVNLTDDQALRARLAALEAEDTPAARAALNRQLEQEIRYLGSAELAYFGRMLLGREPGVPFGEILRDVERVLKVEVPPLGPDRERLKGLVEGYVSQQFERLPPEEQQRLLVELGVEQDKAAAFIKRSAGVFAIPALIQAFGTLVVDGLIKRVIFGTIAKLIGSQLSNRLFQLIAARFPWWLRWIGPAAWTVSVGWTVLDLQGPAMRKTAPVVLYLGVCALRQDGAAAGRPR